MSIEHDFKITAEEKAAIVRYYVRQFHEFAAEINTGIEIALDPLWSRGPHDDVVAEVAISGKIKPRNILNILELLR